MSEKREQNPLSDIQTYALSEVESLLNEEVLVKPTDPENEGLVAISRGRDFKLRAKLAAKLPNTEKASEILASAFESVLNNVGEEHRQTRIEMGQAYVDFLVQKEHWADGFEFVQSGEVLSNEEHSEVSGYFAGKAAVFLDNLSKEEQEDEYDWLMDGVAEVLGLNEDSFDFMSAYARVLSEYATESGEVEKIEKARQAVDSVAKAYLSETDYEMMISGETQELDDSEFTQAVVFFYLDNIPLLKTREDEVFFDRASDFEKEEIIASKESAMERWTLRIKLIESLIKKGMPDETIVFQIRDYLEDVMANTDSKFGHAKGLQDEGSLALLGPKMEQEEFDRSVFDLGLRLIYLVELAKITAGYDGYDMWSGFVDEKHETDLTSIVGIMNEDKDAGLGLIREMIEICGKLDRKSGDRNNSEFIDRARDFLEMSEEAVFLKSDAKFVFLVWFGWRDKAEAHDIIETQRDDAARLEAATAIAEDYVKSEEMDWEGAAKMLDLLAERIAADESVLYEKVFGDNEVLLDDVWDRAISVLVDTESDGGEGRHVGGSLKSSLADLVPNFLISQIMREAEKGNLQTVKNIMESGVMRVDKKAEVVLAILEMNKNA